MYKLVLLILVTACHPVSASCVQYLDIGVGYKFHETKQQYIDNQWRDVNTGKNPSAVFEIGCRYYWGKVAIKHDSNWFDGPPFNNNQEYYKTEFIIYKTFLLK